jgi:hypothetical protein
MARALESNWNKETVGEGEVSFDFYFRQPTVEEYSHLKNEAMWATGNFEKVDMVALAKLCVTRIDRFPIEAISTIKDLLDYSSDDPFINGSAFIMGFRIYQALNGINKKKLSQASGASETKNP